MALKKDRVIVLKSVNFKEADKILTVFGLHSGKFGIIAKGVRKINSRNRGNMQTMSVVDITYYEGRNLGNLRESSEVIQPDFTDIPVSNIEKVLYMLNRILPDSQAEPAVFEKLLRLYQSDFSLRDVNRFRVHTLIELGFLTDMQTCINCEGHKNLKYYHQIELGMVCEQCQQYFEKIHLKPIDEVRYESEIMDIGIDNYIKQLVT